MYIWLMISTILVLNMMAAILQTLFLLISIIRLNFCNQTFTEMSWRASGGWCDSIGCADKFDAEQAANHWLNQYWHRSLTCSVISSHSVDKRPPSSIHRGSNKMVDVLQTTLANEHFPGGLSDCLSCLTNLCTRQSFLFGDKHQY